MNVQQFLKINKLAQLQFESQPAVQLCVSFQLLPNMGSNCRSTYYSHVFLTSSTYPLRFHGSEMFWVSCQC